MALQPFFQLSEGILNEIIRVVNCQLCMTAEGGITSLRLKHPRDALIRIMTALPESDTALFIICMNVPDLVAQLLVMIINQERRLDNRQCASLCRTDLSGFLPLSIRCPV